MATVILLLLQSVFFGAYADTYTVTSTTDGNALNQLRGAINNATGIAGSHTITVGPGTYVLGSTISIGNINNQNITIVNAVGATPIIDINSIDRIFIFNTFGTTTGLSITLSGFTLRNGRLTSDAFGGGAILGGGPANNYTITNCTFTNNTIGASAGVTPGGAIRMSGGGVVNINNCTFTGNSNPQSGGGAIRFDVVSGEAGAFNVTNCTFNNNTSAGTDPSGGAISVGIAGIPAGSVSCNITKNNFTNNSAGAGNGGAIAISNGSAGNTANINYNRFFNNTATAAGGIRSAVTVAGASGNVNLSNNWWGCNTGPTGCADKAATNGSGSGTNTYTPYLQLRSTTNPSPATLCSGATVTIVSGFTLNSAGNTIIASDLTAFTGLTITFNNPTLGTISPATATIQAATGTATTTYTAGSTGGTGEVFARTDNVPVSDVASRASVTVNAAPTVTPPTPASATRCVGATVSFSVTGGGSGTLSYQWYRGNTPITNGGSSSISGATTATLTIANPGTADAATDYNVRVSSTTGCGPVTSANATLIVNSLPAITDPPDNVITCAGTAVSFTAAASGSGTLSYQWYKAGNTTIVNNGPTGTGSTISGATSAMLTITNPGTTDATTYNVRVTSSTGCTPATSANATLTVNTLPAIGSQPASITSGACTGNPVSFTATASGSGTLSYQWYKGATALNNGATGTGSIIAGATTATLTINNPSPADNATNYNVIVSSTTNCTPAQSNNTALTVAAPVTATATTSGSKVISSTNTVITNTSCNLIATVTPSGAVGTQVGGNVSATVTITGTVQTTPNGSPYVQRHYDIVPSVNPATATATLTLYFTQAEFTAYNAAPNHGTNLPVDATDAANNKANIRIIQYHGTGTLPGNYTGTSEEINPVDNAIIWNGTYSRWEVTFSVNGFSGFYLVSMGSQILPFKLISFTGHTDGNTTWLQWKTSDEINVNHFEIERSIDAVRFTKLGQLNAGSSNYNFTDKPDVKTVYYYRLKIADKDGKVTYSHTVAVSLKKAGVTVQALPNPFTDKLMLSVTSPQQSKAEIRLTDVSGKTLLRKTVTLQTGINAITLNEVSTLNKGNYILQITNDKLNETIKVVKAE